jgi:O-antigen/teichoic acid export membrane protein
MSSASSRRSGQLSAWHRERAAHRGAPPIRRASLLADFLATSVSQALSVGLNAASLAIISRRLGEEDLGLYTLERRGMSLLQPFVLLGLTVATPRFIALTIGRGSSAHRQYEVAGLSLVAGFAALLSAVILVVPRPFAALFFGSADAVGLARALAGFVFVTACFQVVYSVFRGHLRMLRANLLEILVVGAIPVVVALFGPTDLVAFMWIINGAIAMATLAVAGPLVTARSPGSRLLGALSREGRELLRFGLVRTPGDLAIVALFSLAPLAVVHSDGATEAGYASIIQSSLNLVGVAAVPLGVLLLPRVALDIARADERVVERYSLLARATLDASIGVSGLLFLAAPLMIAFWLPSIPTQAVTGLQVVAFGLPGYVFYVVFRSFLDAADVRPLSSLATLMGLGTLTILVVLLLYAGVFEAVVATSLALAVALCVTGTVTFVLVNRRLGNRLRAKHHLVALGSFLAMVIVGLAVRDGSLVLVAAVTLVSTAAYCSLLYAYKPEWLQLLLARTLGR